MDKLIRLTKERDRKRMVFMLKASDISLQELYLLTTYGRKVERLEPGDFEAN